MGAGPNGHRIRAAQFWVAGRFLIQPGIRGYNQHGNASY
jgi:hypothetical protein